MKKRKWFYVRKRLLLAIAGCVWLIAGFNVARLGILAYQRLLTVTVTHVILSVAVFCGFGLMFAGMTGKHEKRICGYRDEFQPVYRFFDLKSYLIMAVMMGGGMWLRFSGLAPEVFIAVFYTGLGCALTLAGVLFGWIFIRSQRKSFLH